MPGQGEGGQDGEGGAGAGGGPQTGRLRAQEAKKAGFEGLPKGSARAGRWYESPVDRALVREQNAPV